MLVTFRDGTPWIRAVSAATWTNLPALCAQLATVWSLIEGAPLSQNRGDEPPVIPETAIAGVRATMDTIQPVWPAAVVL